MRRYKYAFMALLAVALLPPLMLPFTIYADGLMTRPGLHAPALASNSMDNTSLLVFTEVDTWGRSSIKAAIVDAYGNPMEQTLSVSDGSASVPYNARPSVAWDADSGRYLVVWHDERTGWYNIRGQLVGMDGLMIGANFSVSDCECDQIFPVASNSPQEGLFMVAWEDYRPGEFNLQDAPSSDIWGQMIEPTGAPIANGVAENMQLYIAPGEQSNISITSDGADTFMLAFEDHEDGLTAITGQMVWAYDASTISAPGEGCAVSAWHEAGSVGSPTVAAMPGEGFVVYWRDHRDEGAIHAQSMDYNCMDAGSPFEENVSIGGNLAQAEWPVAALGANPSRQLVAWQEYDGKSYDIVAAFMDALGLGDEPVHVRMVTKESLSEINAAVVHNRLVPNYLIAYESTDHSSVYDILIASITDPVYPEIKAEDPSQPYDDMYVDFGQTMAGVAAHRTLTIWNESPMAELRVRAIASEGPFFGIAAETCTLLPIAPQSSCTVSVKFSSDEIGAYEGLLYINSNDPDEQEMFIDLYAEATVPRVFLPDGDTAEFGAVPVGSAAEQELSLRNTGTYPLLLEKALISGSEDMRISWDTCSGKSLLPLTSCYMAVSYAPRSEGQAMATISIPTSDPDAALINIEARGHGALPEMEGVTRESVVDMGVHTAGAGTYTKPIYLHNTGLAPLYIEDVQAEGALSISIIEDQCTGFYTEPGGSCLFMLAFTPSATGQETATVMVVTNDPEARTAEFTVYGTSVSIDVPDMRMEVISMDSATQVAELGMVYPGYSISETMTLHNDGTGPLALAQARIEGEGFYIARDGCSRNIIEPGASCEIAVLFNPLSPGEYRGALTVQSNDPDNNLSEVALRAWGQLSETAPTAPGLIYPSEGEMITGGNAEISWTASFDLEGNDISYTVALSTSNEFTNPSVLPVDLQMRSANADSAAVPYTALLLFGAALMGAGLSRRRLALCIVIALMASVALGACGNSGGRVIAIKGASSTGDAITYMLHSLSPGTTYYWKVTATDSTGLSTQSEARSFSITP